MKRSVALASILSSTALALAPSTSAQTEIGDRIVGSSFGRIQVRHPDGSLKSEVSTGHGVLVPRYDVRGGYIWQSNESIGFVDEQGQPAGGFPITTGAGFAMDVLLDGTVVLPTAGGVVQYDREGNVLRTLSNGAPPDWHSDAVVVTSEQTLLNLVRSGSSAHRIVELALDGAILSSVEFVLPGGGAPYHLDVDPAGDYWVVTQSGRFTEIDDSGAVIGGFDLAFGIGWIVNGFDVTPQGDLLVARSRIFPVLEGQLLTYGQQGNQQSLVSYGPHVLSGTTQIDLVDEQRLGNISCYSIPNSASLRAELLAVGSTNAGAHDLRLSATGLPPEQFGYYLASMSSATVAFPGNSQGILCLGGPLARLVGTAQSSGPGGSLFARIDTSAIPLNPTVAIQAGETWYFQAWFRDFQGYATSNFTDALQISFQ